MPPDIGENFDSPVNSLTKRQLHAYAFGASVEPSRLRNVADRLYDQAAQLEMAALERQTRIERYGPQPPEGTVVRFKKSFTPGGTRYSYAAIRVGNRWYLSHDSVSRLGPVGRMTWVQLLEFANFGKIRVATQWRELGSDD